MLFSNSTLKTVPRNVLASLGNSVLYMYSTKYRYLGLFVFAREQLAASPGSVASIPLRPPIAGDTMARLAVQ